MAVIIGICWGILWLGLGVILQNHPVVAWLMVVVGFAGLIACSAWWFWHRPHEESGGGGGDEVSGVVDEANVSNALQIRVSGAGASAVNHDGSHPNPLWRSKTFVSTGSLTITNLTAQRMNLTPLLWLENGMGIEPLRTEQEISARFREMADTPPFFGPVLVLEPFATEDGYFAFLPLTDWYNQGANDVKNHRVVLTDQLTNRKAVMPWGGSYEPA